MKNLFLLLFSIMALGGCVVLEKGVCTEETRVDVAGLEGNFAFKFYNPETLDMEVSVFSFSRIAKGHYRVTGGGELHTCVIAGLKYVEDASMFSETQSDERMPYRVETTWSESGEQGFQLILLGASRGLLDAGNIPYRVERKTDAAGDETMRLVIENKEMNPEDTVQYLDGISLSLTMMPTSMPVSSSIEWGRIKTLIKAN